MDNPYELSEKVNHALQDFNTYIGAGFDPMWSATRAVYDHRLYRNEEDERRFYAITGAPKPPPGAKVFYM